MNKLLITVLLAGCMGSAWAKSSAPAAAPDQNPPNSTAVSVERHGNANALCVQGGTRIKRQMDTNSERAVDCATAVPGKVYTRRELDSTGTNMAGLLQAIDPSIH